MNTSRCNRLTAVAACTVATLFATSAIGSETWRMAHKMPPDSPEGKVFQLFADKVDEYSNGELTVTVYPNEQLGKTDAVLEQLKLGTVQLYPEGSTYMNKWVEEIKFISSAFLFDDRDHWVRFMNSDMVKDWYDKAAEDAGIGILGDPTAVVRGPYRVMVTNQDVQNFDDMQGLQLRMAPSKIAVETWNWLGADVKTLPWTDVYQSIDKGIVSAVNSPIALVESMRFHEVAPHIVRHDEYYQSIAFMMNQPAYDALSPELQEALDKAIADAGAYSEELMGTEATESLARMQADGVSFVEIDRQPFIDRMEAWYADQAAQGILPEGFMDAVEATRTVTN
ncbi:MAG: TRAP transporter substrate-binding protein [Pseudomonadota bacterium]